MPLNLAIDCSHVIGNNTQATMFCLHVCCKGHAVSVKLTLHHLFPRGPRALRVWNVQLLNVRDCKGPHLYKTYSCLWTICDVHSWRDCDYQAWRKCSLPLYSHFHCQHNMTCWRTVLSQNVAKQNRNRGLMISHRVALCEYPWRQKERDQ
jgi:hypothetical protein